jgi:uncharacterized protein (TIGR03086 family)
MGWSPDTVFVEGLGFFSVAVARLQPADWQRVSPCSAWTALDVLGHVGTAVGFGTKLLRGEQPDWTPSDPPGAGVEGEPDRWWDALVTPARLAVVGVDLDKVVDSPAGRRRVGEGLSFPALDLYIHAWDLTHSAGADIDIPLEAMEFAHGVLDPIPPEQLRSPRVFSAPVVPPPDATPTQEFIAWTGRDAQWAPPSGNSS